MLKDERFRLGMGDRDINLSNIAYEGARFLAILLFYESSLRGAFGDLCFAYINDNSLGVVHSVNAGLMSYCLEKGSRIEGLIHTKGSRCPAFRGGSLSVLTQRHH